MRLRLTLAFLVLHFYAHGQEPPPPVRVVQPKNAAPIRVSGLEPLPPLEHPVQVTVMSEVPAPKSWFSGGPSFGEVPLRDKLSLARSAAGPASIESRTALRSAANLWQRVLKLTLPPPDNSATLTWAGEDVAVAWGNLPGDKRFLLWDEPVSTSLLLEVPPATLTDPAALQSLLTSLLLWGEQGLYSLQVQMSPSSPNEKDILRGYPYFRRVYQMYAGPDFAVSGAYDGTRAWLALSYSTGDGTAIAERFPPLRERLSQWTTIQLLSAIGRGGRAAGAPRFDLGTKSTRDGILMGELIRREDFSVGDLWNLIDNQAHVQFPNGSMPDALIVTVQSGNGARFTAVILDYFHAIESRHPDRAESQASNTMYNLNRFARPGFCALPTDFLPQHLAITASLQYLTKFCSGQEAYDAVQMLEDRPEYTQQRSEALAQLATRLAEK